MPPPPSTGDNANTVNRVPLSDHQTASSTKHDSTSPRQSSYNLPRWPSGQVRSTTARARAIPSTRQSTPIHGPPRPSKALSMPLPRPAMEVLQNNKSFLLLSNKSDASISASNSQLFRTLKTTFAVRTASQKPSSVSAPHSPASHSALAKDRRQYLTNNASDQETELTALIAVACSPASSLNHGKRKC